MDILLDEIDREILTVLQANGRISNVELSQYINLSPPATLTRVRRLENAGFIDGYVALVNRSKIGYDMICFVSVTLSIHQVEQVQHFREAMQALPQVLECHHVTGDYDYFLKIVIKNRDDLEQFLMTKLTPIKGVARIHTSLVLREIKQTTVMDIPSSTDGD
jgi:Lrp/AsnC family transcriptional regulator, leucine-responsive regulatory protein